MKHPIILLMLLLASCNPCDPETFDMGKLPDEALLFVPYQDGEEVKLIHSAGHTINFRVAREIQQKTEYLCDRCCDIIKYEEDVTVLSPDYPVFQISIAISNFDSALYSCGLRMTGASFVIPTQEFQYNYFNQVDSIVIGGEIYEDVFMLNYEPWYYSQENPVQVDSLYYNYSHGILKIIMSNNEFYEIEN
jgi:hypothetical protein